jgi:hypothetical protein
MSYPGALSFHLAWGLDVHLQQWSSESQIVRVARELDVIRDVIACHLSRGRRTLSSVTMCPSEAAIDEELKRGVGGQLG